MTYLISIVPLALILSASATPVRESSGVSIPLDHRSSFIGEGGAFDHDKATLEKARIHK